jgi:hypothetical protein
VRNIENTPPFVVGADKVTHEAKYIIATWIFHIQLVGKRSFEIHHKIGNRAGFQNVMFATSFTAGARIRVGV